MKHVLAIGLLVLLAGCGKQEALRPVQGQSLPPKPAMARETPTPEALLTPAQEARPTRNVEPVRRSQERPEDPFELPPNSDSGR